MDKLLARQQQIFELVYLLLEQLPQLARTYLPFLRLLLVLHPPHRRSPRCRSFPLPWLLALFSFLAVFRVGPAKLIAGYFFEGANILLKLQGRVDTQHKTLPLLLYLLNLLIFLQQRHHESFGFIDIEDGGNCYFLDPGHRTFQYLVDLLEVCVERQFAEHALLLRRDLKLIWKQVTFDRKSRLVHPISPYSAIRSYIIFISNTTPAQIKPKPYNCLDSCTKDEYWDDERPLLAVCSVSCLHDRSSEILVFG